MYAGVARSEGLSISDEEMEVLMREVHDRLPLEISGSWRYELPWFSALIEEVFVEDLGLERRKLKKQDRRRRSDSCRDRDAQCRQHQGRSGRQDFRRRRQRTGQDQRV